MSDKETALVAKLQQHTARLEKERAQEKSLLEDKLRSLQNELLHSAGTGSAGVSAAGQEEVAAQGRLAREAADRLEQAKERRREEEQIEGKLFLEERYASVVEEAQATRAKLQLLRQKYVQLSGEYLDLQDEFALETEDLLAQARTASREAALNQAIADALQVTHTHIYIHIFLVPYYLSLSRLSYISLLHISII